MFDFGHQVVMPKFKHTARTTSRVTSKYICYMHTNKCCQRTRKSALYRSQIWQFCWSRLYVSGEGNQILKKIVASSILSKNSQVFLPVFSENFSDKASKMGLISKWRVSRKNPWKDYTDCLWQILIVSKQSADLLQKMPMLLNLTVLFIAIHKMQLYKETTGVSVFKPSADKL